ncbi:hypothetical protein JHK84_050512 [Glycine max]|nr:hypothetical protein JHK84_050512 [Glycine max]
MESVLHLTQRHQLLDKPNLIAIHILEALTTLKCCESFSMERLELLVDSVLKYAVSYHLFLRYPEKHKGQLSDWRSALTSNSSLHRLGIECK